MSNLIDITDMTDSDLDALLGIAAPTNCTDVTDMTDAELDALLGADDAEPTMSDLDAAVIAETGAPRPRSNRKAKREALELLAAAGRAAFPSVREALTSHAVAVVSNYHEIVSMDCDSLTVSERFDIAAAMGWTNASAWCHDAPRKQASPVGFDYEGAIMRRDEADQSWWT